MRSDLLFVASLAASAAPVPVVANMNLVDPGHEGVVVEQATGAPIAGARVIGKWTVSYSSLAHSGERCVKVFVVESDAAGNFRLPPWETQDTPVTAIDLYVSAYKPGYRFDKSPEPIVAHPSGFAELIGVGTVKLPKGNAMRVQMARWDPEPAQRADYLLKFLPSIRCMFSKDEWGTIYFVSRAIYQEFEGFPPEVRRTSKRDYMPWLKEQVDADRSKLQSEHPSWIETPTRGPTGSE